MDVEVCLCPLLPPSCGTPSCGTPSLTAALQGPPPPQKNPTWQTPPRTPLATGTMGWGGAPQILPPHINAEKLDPIKFVQASQPGVTPPQGPTHIGGSKAWGSPQFTPTPGLAL